MSNQPAHKLRVGLISATIWANDGFFSIDLTRSYKNADGQWQNANNLAPSDLLNAAKCLERTEIWIGRQINATK